MDGHSCGDGRAKSASVPCPSSEIGIILCRGWELRMGKGGGGQVKEKRLSGVVWGGCPVKDKKAKDLAPTYCHHPEPSLM